MKNFKIYQNIILLVSMLLLPMQTYSWHWYSGDVTTGAIIYNSVVSESRTIALGVNKHGHLNTRTGNIVSNAGATVAQATERRGTMLVMMLEQE